jgi:hypothetical protein
MSSDTRRNISNPALSLRGGLARGKDILQVKSAALSIGLSGSIASPGGGEALEARLLCVLLMDAPAHAQPEQPSDGVGIIRANVGATTHEMAVRSDDVGPIFVHLKVNPRAGSPLALTAFMSGPLG